MMKQQFYERDKMTPITLEKNPKVLKSEVPKKQASTINLYKELNDKGYVCSQNMTNKILAALNTKPVAGAILDGPAGTGKSYLPEILAKIYDCNYFFYQCFPQTQPDDLLVKILPSENTVSGVKLTDGVMFKAARASLDITRRTILVLDEWDKTRPSADSFLLDFLQTGRIDYQGQSLVANLSNLTVFLPKNDERDLCEPLLRRLPKIDFEPLMPDLVKEALELNTEHANHPFLKSAVLLYARCLMAKLSKPCTIQELRQMLDALTLLGEQADWDSLIYQFVTKTHENHMKLKAVESQDIAAIKKAIAARPKEKLSEAKYVMEGETVFEKERLEERRILPSVPKAKGMLKKPEAMPKDLDLNNSFGLVPLTEDNYNQVVKLVTEPGPTASVLKDTVEVVEYQNKQYLNFIKPVLLADAQMLGSLWGQHGEVMLIEPRATLEDIKRLQSERNIKIPYYSETEILAKCAPETPSGNLGNGIDMRWTPPVSTKHEDGTETFEKGGLEAVVDLRSIAAYNHTFAQNSFELKIPLPAIPLGAKGLTKRKSLPNKCRTKNPRIFTGTQQIYLGKSSAGAPLYAQLVITKLPQRAIDLNDEVLVKGELKLPVEADGTLLKDLCFNKRVSLFNAYLDPLWGKVFSEEVASPKANKPSYLNYRSMGLAIPATSYKAGVIAVNNYLHSEIVKLILAVRSRRQALLKAEASLK